MFFVKSMRNATQRVITGTTRYRYVGTWVYRENEDGYNNVAIEQTLKVLEGTVSFELQLA